MSHPRAVQPNMGRSMGGGSLYHNSPQAPSSGRPYSSHAQPQGGPSNPPSHANHHLPGLNNNPAAPGSGPSAHASGNGIGGGPNQPTISQTVALILQLGAERNMQASQMLGLGGSKSGNLTTPILARLDKEVESVWVHAGRVAEAIGDWSRALSSYETALRHSPYNIEALASTGNILRQQEKFVEASEYFTRFLHLNDTAGEVWGALGHCYLMIDDLQKAYTCYQQAIHHIPDAKNEPKLWYGIGILYDRYGSLEHAEEAFASVINTDPKFEKANEIYFRLGIIYKQQKNSHASLQCFKYILHNPPRPLTEIDIWFQIGHVYEQIQDYDSAKDAYDRVLTANPNHAKVLQQLGGLYHRRPASFYDPEKSVIILTKSLEQDANDPFSWYLLGRAYMTGGNFGKAYEAYQQAVYRDGKNPAFWCSIGVLYYQINQYHDSLDAYSRAIRINPYLSEVWHNLGALYESCNDQMNDAIDAYRRTLQLDETNEAVRLRLDQIESHRKRGSPLSPPPKPKDISPSSSSWTFANSASGVGPPGPAMAFGQHPEAQGAPQPSHAHPHPHSPPRNHSALPPSSSGGYDRQTPRDAAEMSMMNRRREEPARASPNQARTSISNQGQQGHNLPHMKSFSDSRPASQAAGGPPSHDLARRPVPAQTRQTMDEWDRRSTVEASNQQVDRRQTHSPPVSMQSSYRARAPAALNSFTSAGPSIPPHLQTSSLNRLSQEPPSRGSPSLLADHAEPPSSARTMKMSAGPSSASRPTKSPVSSVVKQPTSASRKASIQPPRAQTGNSTPNRTGPDSNTASSTASPAPEQPAPESAAPTRQVDENYDEEPADSLMALASASSNAGPINPPEPTPTSAAPIERSEASPSLKITLKRSVDETDAATRSIDEVKRLKAGEDTPAVQAEQGEVAENTAAENGNAPTS